MSGKDVEKEPFDVQAINPFYRGAMMSDVARALVTDPKVRARLAERWKGRSVTSEESRENGSRVNSTR